MVWLIAVLVAVGMGANAVVLAGSTDADYAQLLADNPDAVEVLAEIDAALLRSKRLERGLLGYLDLLQSRPALRQHELAFIEVLLADSLLQANLLEFELLSSQDTGDIEEVAHFDIIAATDAGFAAHVQELERTAVAAGAQAPRRSAIMAFLEANPDIAEPIFAAAEGPVYVAERPDRNIVAFVEYLADQPELYRVWRDLYQYLNADLPLCRRFTNHCFWYRARPPLRRALWRYRLRAAEDPEVHQVVWSRRMYLGSDSGLAELIWQHRLMMARKPDLRRFSRYLLSRPEISGGLMAHRRWLRRQ